MLASIKLAQRVFGYENPFAQPDRVDPPLPDEVVHGLRVDPQPIRSFSGREVPPRGRPRVRQPGRTQGFLDPVPHRPTQDLVQNLHEIRRTVHQSPPPRLGAGPAVAASSYLRQPGHSSQIQGHVYHATVYSRYKSSMRHVSPAKTTPATTQVHPGAPPPQPAIGDPPGGTTLRIRSRGHFGVPIRMSSPLGQAHGVPVGRLLPGRRPWPRRPTRSRKPRLSGPFRGPLSVLAEHPGQLVRRPPLQGG